jgi:hypothetical protein
LRDQKIDIEKDRVGRVLDAIRGIMDSNAMTFGEKE